MIKQIIRFLFTGGLATALQYTVLWVGVDYLACSAAMASGVGYLTGSLLSYVMNYFFTFKSNRPHSYGISRFYLMVAIGWGINTGTMALLADSVKWNKWLAQILATALALIWNYMASRFWVFRSIYSRSK